MKQGGKFYNACGRVGELKSILSENGYRIALGREKNQDLILGNYMPPYGEILDDRIVTICNPNSDDTDRKKELEKLEKILDKF